MNLPEMTDRAMTLRKLFADAAHAKGGREWTREEVMQGFVGDVGDLMKLVMARNGMRDIGDVDRKLAHELADCLWSVLVLAKLYDVELEHAFSRMITEVSAKLAAK